MQGLIFNTGIDLSGQSSWWMYFLFGFDLIRMPVASNRFFLHDELTCPFRFGSGNKEYALYQFKMEYREILVTAVHISIDFYSHIVLLAYITYQNDIQEQYDFQ